MDHEPDVWVESHIWLVEGLAGKVHSHVPRVRLDDLVGYGMEGLVRASRSYNPTRGTRFSTYAYYRINGAIFDGIREMGWLSPAAWRELKGREAVNEYMSQQSLHGSREEQAGQLADALTGMATIFLTMDAASVEEVSNGRPDPEELAARADELKQVRRAMKLLDEKERRLLEAYYFEGKSMTEAGRSLGLSPSWSSRLHARGVGRLRRFLSRPESSSQSPVSRRGASI